MRLRFILSLMLPIVLLSTLANAAICSTVEKPKTSFADKLLVIAGPKVWIENAVVVASWQNEFYIESPERSGGIRVELVNNGLAIGDVVDVMGELKRGTDGIPYLAASSVSKTNSTVLLKPLGCSSHTLIDSNVRAWQWVYYPELHASKYEWHQGTGLITTDLLIRTWGKIAQIDPNGTYFYITDGTDIWDGTLTNGQKNLGIKVLCSNVDARNYAIGQYIAVTGISATFIDGDTYARRMIRARNAQDVQIIPSP